MNLKYYIIRGRGENGLKFQLAKVEDEQGNTFKGQYDMARQFESIDELHGYLAELTNTPAAELTLKAMVI